jgi:protein-S-isoprenylcysteine O-methyltransferase Ste14
MKQPTKVPTNKIESTPNRIPWPPLIYAGAILLGALSKFVLPTPWIESPGSDFLFAIGALIILAGLTLDIRAMQTLHAAKTTILPIKGADHLVTSGPFKISRNPIYLGNTLLTFGAGLVFGIIWFLPLAFIAALLTSKLAIEREEAHLSAKFGKNWRDYAGKVRRWF